MYVCWLHYGVCFCSFAGMLGHVSKSCDAYGVLEELVFRYKEEESLDCGLLMHHLVVEEGRKGRIL